jgi:uncharacterized protein YbaP (TraB family)
MPGRAPSRPLPPTVQSTQVDFVWLLRRIHSLCRPRRFPQSPHIPTPYAQRAERRRNPLGGWRVSFAAGAVYEYAGILISFTQDWNLLMKRFARTAAAALLAAGSMASPAPAAAQQPAARNILYRVEGPSGATVYMLGSIHLLTEDAYPLAQPVEAAYADAERVFFEVNLDSLQGRAMELMPRALLRDGRTLRGEIPADLYALVEQTATRYAAMGINMAVLDRLEPWMVAMVLSQLEWSRVGLEAKYGIDYHFEGRAQKDGKVLGALESVDFQMGLMDGFSGDQQVQFLRQTLEDLPRTGEMMDEMVQAWRAGDAAAIDALMNSSMGENPEVYARMLTDRNAAWVPQIEQLLRGSDDVLVVVGAAHLVGGESVVAMLRSRGYTVDQL